MATGFVMKTSMSALRGSSSLPSPSFIRVAAPLSLHPSRRFHRTRPDESKGPRESTSFAFNLFKGDFKADNVFPYPASLTNDEIEELGAMVNPLEKWTEEVNDPLKNDELETVPDEVMASLAELGAFGLQVPMDYDGLELNNRMYGRLAEVIGADDLGLSIVVGAHQSIGFKGILLFGTPEQKAKYLPDLAVGKRYAAFALTEAGSGSDASSIKTRAVLNEEGTHYILNGGKVWISNAGFASVFTVFCKTPVTDPESGTTQDKITALIVEREFGGVTNGKPNKKMGIKCSNTTEVFFDNVPVPVENVLDKPGNGFKVAMQILNNGRFGMGAALAGTQRTAIRSAAEFAASRSQFGQQIHSFGAIQEKLAEMSVRQYATESMAYTVAANMDAGVPDYQVEAAISKIFASECAWHVVDEAIQIMGGMGFMRETGLEKRMRDLRIFRIFEGTNDILRLFVALNGLQFAGAHLAVMLKKLTDPMSIGGVIVDEAPKRAMRLFGLSQGPPVSEVTHPKLAPAAKRTSKAIEDFGFACEYLLRKHGKKIVDQQFQLKRIADGAIDIYASVCVLSRATNSLNKKLPSAQHEQLLALLWCDLAADRIAANLAQIGSAQHKQDFKMMAEIARNVIDVQGCVQGHPLGV